MGEAGHPGPGFDGPTLGISEENDSAWGGNEGTIDQRWLEDFCAAELFVKCQKFEGPGLATYSSLMTVALGGDIDDRRRASCTTSRIGLGLDSFDWPKYNGGAVGAQHVATRGRGG